MLLAYDKDEQEDLDARTIKDFAGVCEREVIMKEATFQKLLKSIDEAREIHAGKRKPSRVFSCQTD